jgi:hypothetical protein
MGIVIRGRPLHLIEAVPENQLRKNEPISQVRFANNSFHCIFPPNNESLQLPTHFRPARASKRTATYPTTPITKLPKKFSTRLSNNLPPKPAHFRKASTDDEVRNAMFSDQQNLSDRAAAEPHQQNRNPAADHPEFDHPDFDHPENQKRNSGRTGPTTNTGRATSARNATRHGMCATTLILDHENEADFLQLLNCWLDGYQNPTENTLLYTFVLKTAQAEWFRLRAQKEYDYCLRNHGAPPMTAWQPNEIKMNDLVARYLTTAERRFQREYRMLEHHWKTHHKPLPEPKKSTRQPDPEPPRKTPKIRFINNETGESIDAQGNHYPPPPGYISRPIIPGVYDPDHPAYEGPRHNKK